MSRTVNNECVCCGLPCLGDFCRYKNVIRYYCDNCNNEFDSSELYDVDGDMLCEECLKEHFKTVEEMEKNRV